MDQPNNMNARCADIAYTLGYTVAAELKANASRMSEKQWQDHKDDGGLEYIASEMIKGISAALTADIHP